MMTACSSDQNDDAANVSGKTGTFELSIRFDDSSKGTRAPSTAIPSTSWSNIKQIQFFLYDNTGKIAWSAIEVPGNGAEATRKYTYATVPAATYTLVAVANAQSDNDAVFTTTSEGLKNWSVANVYQQNVANLAIKHATGSWTPAVTAGSKAETDLAGLTPHTQPSEVFMGYQTGVVIASNAPATATLDLKREVSMMRVRLDQKSYPDVVGNVDFSDAKAAVMLYNLPEQMSIREGDTGGVKTSGGNPNTVVSISTNALSVVGAYSNVSNNNDYLSGNYGWWKDVIVYPNNDGRATNATTGAKASKPYFIVICGIAKAGHHYVGGAAAAVGAPVFWYGQINEVFTPNNIREVDVILQTGGLPEPPPVIIEYGGLEITVNTPKPWGQNILTSDPIEL
ncbi:FimB/Mfa2 family fimbrial subunit [Bacteroides sp. 51]|uniref:FimB/Mfa2 family fimbrial subunit n=1 Tax=Bacteroides sp. 51 TaxID=2302938 RepID=UPI0013D59BE9|nr:FimB/Mfa2 family fimbrial subunit [Bacteroides sp. 51]